MVSSSRWLQRPAASRVTEQVPVRRLENERYNHETVCRDSRPRGGPERRDSLARASPDCLWLFGPERDWRDERRNLPQPRRSQGYTSFYSPYTGMMMSRTYGQNFMGQAYGSPRATTPGPG